MKKINEITCCVIDNGIFIHVARRLARDYKKVYYWSPNERAFPLIRERCIGDGYPDIIRLNSFWPILHEIDLFVFPDIGMSDLQDHLVSMGFPVWGAGSGESLETNRGKFLKILETTGLPVPKYETVRGITGLREHLRDLEDKYIKVSKIRGDFETFHWKSWEEDQGCLDEYAVRFGPLRDEVNFYVFDPIDTEIEDGVDAYCIDGRWPETIIHGMESKDRAYLGTFQKFADLPEEMRIVNEAFSKILGDLRYRGRFSTEVRITGEGDSYFIDPTCRFGSPPSQCEMEMVSNWGEIIWMGANGSLCEMKPAAKFGVQAIIKLDRSSWNVIKCPDILDQWLKVSFSCMIDGCVCVPPDPDGPSEIAWLTAVGDTIMESIENLSKYRDRLPDGICCDFSAMSDLIKEVDKAEEAGMEFTDQPVPSVAEVAHV